jgi:hypothetical protein
MSDTTEIIPWPTSDGLWMANITEIGWFPLQVMALKDDLPSLEQMLLEKESPESAPPRAIAGYVAQWPESKGHWPYTFKGSHPVKEWRKPTYEELTKAKQFYNL